MVQINLTEDQKRNASIDIILHAAQVINSQMPEDDIANDVVISKMYGAMGETFEMRLLVELDHVLNWHTKFARTNKDLSQVYKAIKMRKDWWTNPDAYQALVQSCLATPWLDDLEYKAACSNWLDRKVLEQLSTITLIVVAGFMVEHIAAHYSSKAQVVINSGLYQDVDQFDHAISL